MTRGDGDAILWLDGVCHSFAVPRQGANDHTHHVLADVTFQVARGEIVCVLGPSGCGKSTLLNLAAGLLTPTSGDVYAHGKSVTEPGADRAMMFQDDTLFPWLTVRQNIAFGPKCQHNREQLDDVPKMIELVGLSGFEDYLPGSLSGGMRQRVALARALINRADILLLDEPFASLDAQTREAMQELALWIHERLKPAILLVTHDIEEAVFLGDRVVVLCPQEDGSRFQEAVDIGLQRPRTPEMREDHQLASLRSHLRGILRAALQPQ